MSRNPESRPSVGQGRMTRREFLGKAGGVAAAVTGSLIINELLSGCGVPTERVLAEEDVPVEKQKERKEVLPKALCRIYIVGDSISYMKEGEVPLDDDPETPNFYYQDILKGRLEENYQSLDIQITSLAFPAARACQLESEADLDNYNSAVSNES